MWDLVVCFLIRPSPAPKSRRFHSSSSFPKTSQGVQCVVVQALCRTCTLLFLLSFLCVPIDALQLTMLLPRLLRRTQAPLTALTRSECLLHRSFATTCWQAQKVLQADEESLARLPGLDASKLEITKTITPKKIVPPEELVFGRTFTGLPSTTGAAS